MEHIKNNGETKKGAGSTSALNLLGSSWDLPGSCAPPTDLAEPGKVQVRDPLRHHLRGLVHGRERERGEHRQRCNETIKLGHFPAPSLLEPSVDPMSRR